MGQVRHESATYRYPAGDLLGVQSKLLVVKSPTVSEG